MTYSLARFRQERPEPPFRLGGVFLRAGEAGLIADGLEAYPLRGPHAALDALNPGDLIVLEVIAVTDHEFHFQKIERLHSPEEGAAGIPRPKPHVPRFTRFVRDVREFFLGKGFNEILTPTLVRCPGLEPALEPFQVEAPRIKAYLPTSPEIHLKKVMAQGWTDVFEIKSCFRRDEFSSHHENEFLMLEWYRAFADLDQIERDLNHLLMYLAAKGWVEGAPPELRTTDFATLFREVFDFHLTPSTTREDLVTLCRKLKIHTDESDSFDDLFQRLLLERIEPELERSGPTIVRRFPPSQAALAKIDSSGWADRFEFYWRGLEIANAFNEVTDAEEQKRRWEHERRERERLGTSPLPEDPTLIQALKQGLPPSGGIALGVERLYMACSGVKEILELRLFRTADLLALT